jgi:hypothetical protein
MDDSDTSNVVSTDGLDCLAAESYVRYTSEEDMNKRINQAEPLAGVLLDNDELLLVSVRRRKKDSQVDSVAMDGNKVDAYRVVFNETAVTTNDKACFLGFDYMSFFAIETAV